MEFINAIWHRWFNFSLMVGSNRGTVMLKNFFPANMSGPFEIKSRSNSSVLTY